MTPSIAEAKNLPYEALELMTDNVYRLTVRGRVVGFLSWTGGFAKESQMPQQRSVVI
jgi:hypothetical protein